MVYAGLKRRGCWVSGFEHLFCKGVLSPRVFGDCLGFGVKIPSSSGLYVDM